MNIVKFETTEAIAVTSAHLTVVTSIKPDTLTKHYTLENGGLAKRGSGGMLVEGHAKVVTVSSLEEFAELISSLQHNQALAYGVPPVSETPIVTRGAWEAAGKPDDVTSRTNETFSWPDGPGILMLDYDPPSEVRPKSREELVDIIRTAAPGLREAEILWCPSASSMIKNSETGETLSGVKGQRLYMMVADANDIPRTGKAIADHLWFHGHGEIKVSKSGTLLERTLVDASVWQPNRLDFAAGARCEKPLVQERSGPVVIPGLQKLVDTKICVPELSPSQKLVLSNITEAAKAEKKEEAQAKKEAWLAERVEEMIAADASEDEQERARSDARKALETAELPGDFIIRVVENGHVIEITVAEILAEREKYHNALTLDPLEPDYDGGRPVGKIFTNGKTPVIHSFVHGEKTYRLLPKITCIEILKGKLAEAVSETLEYLKKDPKLFDFGDDLVVVVDGRLYPLDEHALAQCLGERIQFVGYRAKGDKQPIDPPPRLCKQLLALKSQRKLKQLSSITKAPTIRRDGTLLADPGFDVGTGILYCPPLGQKIPLVPDAPTPSQCKEALEVLMEALAGFPFAESPDRGAMLAAVLTAAVRPSLPTAPGFGFDAPAKGSGKTKLSECIAILAGSENPNIFAPSDARNDDEMRKRIAARIFSGARDMIIDNVLGVFNSPALAALLTSASFSDRILGKTQISSAPNKLLLLVTGNNLALSEDLIRRFLIVRIDPQMEKPYERDFRFDPVVFVRERRLEIITAALALIRGQLASTDETVQAKLGSFEDWSRLVGDTVRWVGKHVDGSFGDPNETIDRSLGKDPELEDLQELLQALHQNFGESWFIARDITKTLTHNAFAHLSAETDFVLRHSAHVQLQDAFESILQGRQPTSKTLAWALQNRVDRMAGGFVLRRGVKNHDGVTLWRVERSER